MWDNDISWYGDRRIKPSKIVKETGRGVIKIGTIIGAGILCGMGFSAFKDASEGN